MGCGNFSDLNPQPPLRNTIYRIGNVIVAEPTSLRRFLMGLVSDGCALEEFSHFFRFFSFFFAFSCLLRFLFAFLRNRFSSVFLSEPCLFSWNQGQDDLLRTLTGKQSGEPSQNLSQKGPVCHTTPFGTVANSKYRCSPIPYSNCNLFRGQKSRSCNW